MIKSIIGLPGAGKTLYCVKLAQDHLRRGHIVAANFRIDGCLYHYEPEKLIYWVAMGDPKAIDYKPRIVFIDELNNLFSSREWEKLDARVRLSLSQHRKAGAENTMYYTTQSYGFADRYFRNITAEIYTVNRVLGSWFMAKRYYPGDMATDNEFIPKKNHRNHGMQFFNGKKIYAFYDTYEKIIQSTAGNKLGDEKCMIPSDIGSDWEMTRLNVSTNGKTKYRKFNPMAWLYGNITKGYSIILHTAGRFITFLKRTI